MKKILCMLWAFLISAMLLSGCGEENPNAMPDGNGARMSYNIKKD